ncbi:MAG: hypothetical protein K0S04_2860 [Herbinix sp.]|jgi:hypothetical protein|nr:hypothetical protein [Herbinix sp.]
MDAPRKVIVGYDLCDDFTQISCYSYKTGEPLPIGLSQTDGSDTKIPTVLCVRTDTKQWLYGEEALSCAGSGTGVLVEQILNKVRRNEMVELLETQFSAVSLLEKFFRKSLVLIRNHFPTDPITKLVVTVPDSEPEFVGFIYQALFQLGLEKDRAVVISHAGAYLYYALNQDKALWSNDVGLFDFNKDGLSYYKIQINRKVKPMVAGLVKSDLTREFNWETLLNKEINSAYLFENIANTVLHKQLVTTLYFTGDGFEDGWANETIKKLCVGRRGFMGQNLFTLGACYAAKELSGDTKLQDILLLNDDMVTTSVAIRVYLDTKYIELPLMEAGQVWYEVEKGIEVIPEGEPRLELSLTSIMSTDAVRKILHLEQWSERMNRTTRLRIDFSCESKDLAIIKVTDLGFGELFQGTGYEMIYRLQI